ncbi:DNA-binding protein [Desulfovibrio sp. OttesenSCG-928-A18]|nr:DNA-binding protein [Desulfovibrio sp. OttesenSCG-928-A18]
MKAQISSVDAGGWRCGSCDAPLENMPVDITYMGSSFQVELPRCPRCGYTFIPPELAEGKMLEVERILEDK